MTIRLATSDDIPVWVPLMEAAIEVLQKGFLDDEVIESSKAIMGIDRQLVDDGTYFVVEKLMATRSGRPLGEAARHRRMRA